MKVRGKISEKVRERLERRRKRLSFFDRVRERIKLMLTLNISPHKMALSSALGVLIGMTPYLGFQTYITVLVSSTFRLPFYPMIATGQITNPITIPFVYAFTTKVGVRLLNMDVDIDFEWANLNLTFLWETGKTLIVPFIVGTHVVGLLLAIPTYFITLFIAKMYRKSKRC